MRATHAPHATDVHPADDIVTAISTPEATLSSPTGSARSVPCECRVGAALQRARHAPVTCGCGMLRTIAGFKRMPAVVGMAIFLQYWCAPPSRSVATSQAGAGCVLRVFSFALVTHLWLLTRRCSCNVDGCAACRSELFRCSVKCVSLLFLPLATPTAQRTPTLHAWIVRPTVTAAHPVRVRYWFPLVHFISLTFKPTPLIGLNASLKMPVGSDGLLLESSPFG
jgi:hypothetical protein